MKTERTEFTLASALEGTNIRGFMYTPVVKANVKAIFVIAHGMAEHKERYEEFCDFLAVIAFHLYEMMDVWAIDKSVLDSLQIFELTPDICTVSLRTFRCISNKRKNHIISAFLIYSCDCICAILCSEP